VNERTLNVVQKVDLARKTVFLCYVFFKFYFDEMSNKIFQSVYEILQKPTQNKFNEQFNSLQMTILSPQPRLPSRLALALLSSDDVTFVDDILMNNNGGK
jgi:hypothetical protein